ncbi:MAG: hypothetical protein ACLT5C_08665 [Blautia hansenii]
MEVKIKKKLERFQLAVEFSSDCRRIGILGASGSGKVCCCEVWQEWKAQMKGKL